MIMTLLLQGRLPETQGLNLARIPNQADTRQALLGEVNLADDVLVQARMRKGKDMIMPPEQHSEDSQLVR
jgi:hypothetical protein